MATTNPNDRPTASGPGGTVPRFGMFAGPNYAGGKAWANGQLPTSEAWKVTPIGVLDAVTKNHDINYTYIEQTYKGTDAATLRAKNQALWQSDKEMLSNMLAYQPQNWLEAQYRDAAVQAFIAKADISYGKDIDLVGDWNRDLSGLDSKYGPLQRNDSGGVNWNVFSLAGAGATYTSTGMEALSTSGVNVQVAMLFNDHLQPGNIAAQNVGTLGEGSDPSAAQDYSRRILVPQRDPVNSDLFTAEGYINGKWVRIEYDSKNNKLVRSESSNGQLESQTTYKGEKASGEAGEYGHANFGVTKQAYVNGESVGEAEQTVKNAANLPALKVSPHTEAVRPLVEAADPALFPSAPTAADKAWQTGNAVSDYVDSHDPTDPRSVDAVNGSDLQSDQYVPPASPAPSPPSTILTPDLTETQVGQINAGLGRNPDTGAPAWGDGTQYADASGQPIVSDAGPDAPPSFQGDPDFYSNDRVPTPGDGGAANALNTLLTLDNWDDLSDLQRANALGGAYNLIAGNSNGALPGIPAEYMAGLGFLAALDSGDAGAILVSGLNFADTLGMIDLAPSVIPGLNLLLALDSGNPNAIASSTISLLVALECIPVYGQILAVFITMIG
ncbi:MAG TPA: hypothetical protein VLJ57_08860, partial [Burkholderiaceae bacterium]|nr:hypothetical protein [Burkholderiaceae bacterium]